VNIRYIDCLFLFSGSKELEKPLKMEEGPSTLPKFDGTGSVEFWLGLMQGVILERAWEAAQVVKRASLLLRGDAKTWYENARLYSRELTWDQFSALATQRFSRKNPRHVVSASIGRLKPKAREDIRDFAARMTALANQAEPAIDAADMCGMFLKALPVHYRTLNVAEVEGEDQFEALVHACRRIQMLDSDSDVGVEAPLTRAARVPAAADANADEGSKRKDYVKPAGKFTGSCFYCKRPGHKEEECRLKKSDEAATQRKEVPDHRPGPSTRDTNRRVGWDPKTHQRVNKEGIHCVFCGDNDHEQEDCHKWKRVLALVSDDDAYTQSAAAVGAKGVRKN